MKTKYTEDRFVNGIKITIIQSTKCELKKSKAANFKEELNQSNENKETLKKQLHSSHESKIRGDRIDTMGKQSAAWPVYWECGQTVCWWGRHVGMAVGGRSDRK